MKESKIQQNLKKALEQNGVVINLQGGRYSSGWPDLLFLGSSQTIFLEVKKIDKLPTKSTVIKFDHPATKLQLSKMNELTEKTCAKAFIACYLVEFKKWLLLEPKEIENYSVARAVANMRKTSELVRVLMTL